MLIDIYSAKKKACVTLISPVSRLFPEPVEEKNQKTKKNRIDMREREVKMGCLKFGQSGI